MRTTMCKKLGIQIPIIQAPMGLAVGPSVAAAVSNAGALGMLAPWSLGLDALRGQIRETQALTSKPFGVNLNLEFPQEDRLEVCLQENVPVISFFWRDPAALVDRVKAAGAITMYTAGSTEEAKVAAKAGVDIIVAQGWEAGGHVRGVIATMPLIPAVIDAIAPVPVVAAGGIADGRGLAAAFALGASGAWIGTRLLESEEIVIHPRYRERLFSATQNDTVYLENLYNIGWPNAPHRVLRNQTITAWELAGRPEPGMRPGEGEVVAVSKSRGPIVRYQLSTPAADVEGDVDELSLWAGQGVGFTRKLRPVAEIINEIYRDALTILKQLGGMAAEPDCLP